MRRIVSENDALVSSNSRKENQTPKLGVFIPSYKGVNQYIAQPSGNGALSLMNALGAMSEKHMAEQQAQYDAMEVSDLYMSANNSFREKDEEFLQNCSTTGGKGYTEFATSTYQQLSDEVLSKASNGNVKQKLQLILKNKQADLANNAFRAEKNMYSAFVLSTTEPKVNEVLNSAVKHPEQIGSLSVELATHLEPLKQMLRPDEFDRIAKEKQQQLVYSVGIGQIDNNPEEGAKMLDGEIFKQLSPEYYNRLTKYADTSIKALEHQRKAEQVLAQRLSNEAKEQRIWNYRLSISRGEDISPELEKDTMLTDLQRTKLQVMLEEHKTKVERVANTDNKIQEAKATGEIIDISSKDLERNFNNEIDRINKARAEENGNQPVVSLTEKVELAKQYPNVYNKTLSGLSLELSQAVRSSKDATKIMDACIAITGNENSQFFKVDDKDYSFSDLAISMFKTGKDENAIKEFRDRFYSTTKEDRRSRAEDWKEFYRTHGDDESEFDSSFQKALKEVGIKETKGLFDFGKTLVLSDSPDYLDLKAKCDRVAKEVFLQTGSKTLAIQASVLACQNIAKKTAINGKLEYMINPPTTSNSGFATEREIKSYFDNVKRTAISKAVNIDKTKKVYVGALSATKPIYGFYQLLDEDDSSSKIWLNDNDSVSPRITVDLSKVRGKKDG
jgi:hypothetical protein